MFGARAAALRTDPRVTSGASGQRAFARPPSQILRALAQLTPELVEAEAATGVTSVPLEKPELFAAVVAYFHLVAQKRAVVLTIEDLHWSDRSTLEFLTYLAARIAKTRLLFVATYRSEEVERNPDLLDAVSQMLREATVRNIGLEAFSSADVRALLTGALEGHGTLSAESLHDIESRCDGNPFFAEELLKSALQQRGSSTRADLPLSIRASILQRLGNMSDDERRVLAHAAVLGYRFDPSLLARVMKRDVETVLPALRRARDVNIVVEERATSMRFKFRHALTRQTIYDDMLAFDAHRLHRQILTVLEAYGDERPPLEELAYHAFESKDTAKTLAYNERAGESALAVRALTDAASYFGRALEASADDADDIRLLERLAAVAQMRGDIRVAIACFEKALALLLRRHAYDDAARVMVSLAGERSNAGDGLAIEALEAFLGRYAERLQTPAHDAAVVFAGRLSVAMYRFERTERYLSDVREPDALPPRVRQNHLLTQLNLHAYRGDLPAWQLVAAQLAELVPALPPFLGAVVHYGIAQSGTELGANESVETALRDGNDTVRLWGFAGLAVFGAATEAACHCVRGRIEAARVLLEVALERPDIAVARQLVATTAPLIAIASGDDALVARALDHDLVGSARAGHIDYDAARLLGARGAWLGARGRIMEARGELRLALRALHAPTPACGTLLMAAARYLASEDVARLREILSSKPYATTDLAGRANAALAFAILAERAGEMAEARQHASTAATLYATLGWPILEAQAREIADERHAALALYERCGALADVRRLAPHETTVAAEPFQDGPPLSAREREVAALAVAGMTNGAIAERLTMSVKTVEKHLASIFVKMSVTSRVQLAARPKATVPHRNSAGSSMRTVNDAK